MVVGLYDDASNGEGAVVKEGRSQRTAAVCDGVHIWSSRSSEIHFEAGS